MTNPDRDAAELEVLERLEARHFSIASEDRRHSPSYFIAVLNFSAEDAPAHVAALKRLISRDILTIVQVAGTWALAEVQGRPAGELRRLRAKVSDPRTYLQRLSKELSGVIAAASGALADPVTELERGREILKEVLAVMERLGGTQHKGGT